jgi:hypothetical protein
MAPNGPISQKVRIQVVPKPNEAMLGDQNWATKNAS